MQFTNRLATMVSGNAPLVLHLVCYKSFCVCYYCFKGSTCSVSDCWIVTNCYWLV